jgi:hypothetical protein
MSTNIATFADAEFSMRYKEPFITGGLNKKFAAMPRGVYRGFVLEKDTGGGDRTLNIASDSDAADHVMIYQTETGYSLTIRRTSGDFLVDLSFYESETIVLAVYAVYDVGADTTVVLRSYTESEYESAAEKDELVVLGKIDVPASGYPITTSLIHNDGRTMAWLNRAAEANAWAPLLANTGFEWADAVGTPYERSAYPWRAQVTSGTATLGPSQTGAHSGDKCMELEAGGVAAVGFSLTQFVWVKASEGKRYRVRFYKRALQSAGAGTLTFQPTYVDKDGNGVVGTAESLGVTADADYVEFDKIITIPSGSNIVGIQSFSILGSGLTFSVGVAIRFDDFQAWLETASLEMYPFRDAWVEKILSSLLIMDADDEFSDLGRQPLVQHANNRLKISRADELSGASYTPVGLEILGQLYNLGASLIGSSAQARTSRIYSPPAPDAVSEYTLLWEVPGNAAVSSPVRIYASQGASNDGGIYITVNAEWNGSQWQRDDSADAVMLSVSRSVGFQFLTHLASGSSPWSAWSKKGAFVPNSGDSYFDNAPTIFGEAFRSTEAEAETPRIKIARTGAGTPYRTLIFHLSAPDTTGLNTHFRVYRSHNGDPYYESLEIVRNAYWASSTDLWTKDNTGSSQYASMLRVSNDGFHFQTRSSDTPWADSAWGDTFAGDCQFHSGGILDLGPDAYLNFRNSGSGTNPAHTASQINTLKAKNVVKAWGRITTAGGASVLDGFNIDTDGFNGDYLRIDFPSGSFDNTDYVVFMAFHEDTVSSLRLLSTTNQTASGFEIVGWFVSSGTASVIDLSGDTFIINILVMGEQTSI